MSAKRLFLIDGSGLIFRAYYAIRHLSNSKGHPTNATYGFITMLNKVMREHAPSHIAVAFDAKEKTFRHEIYDQYKANRPAPPEDLVPQFGDIQNVVKAMNIPMLLKPGFEADDIIGTLAKKGIEEGFDEVVVVTSDKDLCQVVGERVRLLDTKKDEWTDVAKVKERFGAGPERVTDFLALCGDSSDNIPGVPGVGEKTAKKLLEQFGSIEGVYAHVDELKGKLKERIVENRDLVDLSYKLVVIKKDVPVDWDLEELKTSDPDPEALADLYSEFEFSSLLENLRSSVPALDRSLYELVLTKDELTAMAEKLRAAGRFAFDTETDSTEPTRANLVGMSFCADDKVAYYVPVAHRYLGAPEQLTAEEAVEILRPLFEDPDLPKIGQNIKYDQIVMARANVKVAGIDFDTMLASYVINPGRMSHSMDALSMEYLQHKCISFKEVAGTGKKQVTFDQVSLDRATEYAAEDAHVTWLLYKVFDEKLSEGDLRKLFEEIEMPLVDVLATMETDGVKIDQEFFAKLHSEYQQRLKSIEGEIHELAGHTFNINSPKQVGQVLFDEIGLKPVKKTKSGPSTDVSVLEALADEHPLPRKLLDYRQTHKLVSTYIDALPKLINPETGRIHGSFNQTVAATGRLSSSNPNLQNIPVRTADGRRIREGFVPEQGKLMLSADYSQIELRVMAHLSGDENMIRHFNEGEDIHRRTAAEVFGIMPQLVSKEERSSAKAINFGILYGISAFRLGKDLGIGTKKAQQYINMYFERYSKVKEFLDETVAAAEQDGYVTTLFGRRRTIPEIHSKNRNVQAMGVRMALNTPIQGTAADLIKMAMINIHRRILDESLPLTMILQVHDELVFEVPKDRAEEMKNLVVHEMEQVYEMSVPLLVDAVVGNNWAEVH